MEILRHAFTLQVTRKKKCHSMELSEDRYQLDGSPVSTESNRIGHGPLLEPESNEVIMPLPFFISSLMACQLVHVIYLNVSIIMKTKFSLFL